MRVFFMVYIITNLLVMSLSAQNLIPNPGFDEILDCPTMYGEIDLAYPWETASNGSPDLYNTCSNVSGIKVPNAGRYNGSYQDTRSGNGYAGFVTFQKNNNSKREWIKTPLVKTLSKNVHYYIMFFVSPDISSIRQSGVYTDAIGLALSDTSYYEEINVGETMSLTPVIENRNELITDTIGWTKISGCYTAKGNERYAIIGNFYTDMETQYQPVGPPLTNYVGVYYIEDVSIIPFDPLPDTFLLCENDEVTVNAGFLDASYRWNTGSEDSLLSINKPGLYSVEAFIDDCVLKDTVRVLNPSNSINLPSDTTLCEDEKMYLSPGIPGTYNWSTGSKETGIFVSDPGLYSVTVSNTCGEFKHSININIEECECNIFIPNVFSPNGDGINDYFEIYKECDLEFQVLRFSVFDRWGNRVYSTAKGGRINWDGKNMGSPANPGVYIWFLEYNIIHNGNVESMIKKGDITLIR